MATYEEIIDGYSTTDGIFKLNIPIVGGSTSIGTFLYGPAAETMEGGSTTDGNLAREIHLIIAGGSESSGGALLPEIYLNGNSTSGGTFIYGRFDEDASGGSTSSGNFVLNIHYIASANSESSITTTNIYDRYHYLIANSRSSGKLIVEKLSPTQVIIIGSSTSSGIFDTDTHIFVSGGSSSSGVADTVRSLIDEITGGSNSSGTVVFDWSMIMSGGSTSSGITDSEVIEAVTTLATYVLNLDTKRTYQFDNYDFRGIGRFNDVLIGAKETQIYDLETTATHDHETDITAYMELGQLDFGLPNHKGIRGIYFECEGGTQIYVTITKVDGTASSFTITTDQFRSLPRTMIDKAFSIKIQNVDGEQIALWRVHAKLNVFEIGGM